MSRRSAPFVAAHARYAPLALAMLLAVAPPALGAPAARPLDTAELAALVDPSRPDALAGLQVAVVVDGKVSEVAFGRRFIHPTDRAQDLPLAVTSLLRVASASKPVAAVLVMQQIERGTLDLDADVGDYLGYWLRNPAFPDAPITLRQLLSHRSSIVDGEGYALPLGVTLASLFQPMPCGPPLTRWSGHRPGTYFEYSNLGWGVIGTVLERVTGERFDRLAQRAVLARAGVEGSFDVASLDAAQRARLAVTYRKGPEEAEAWDAAGPWLAQNDDPRPAEAGGSGAWSAPGALDGIEGYPLGSNGTLFSPQGGLRTNAGQLARLWQCLFASAQRGLACPGRALLKRRSLETMLAPQWTDDPARADDGDTWRGAFRGWGLGVQRFTGTQALDGDSPSPRLDGRPMVGHLAEAYGLFGGAWFTPDGRYGVVYLANGTATPLAAARGARSALYRWEETIVDWAAREAWRW